MADISKLLNSIKNMNNEEAVNKVVSMIKSGEAGITPAQASAMAKQIMPMLNKKQQEMMKMVLRKLK